MLDEEERALALARIDADQVVRTHGRKEPTTLRLVLRAFNLHVSFNSPCQPLLNIDADSLVYCQLYHARYLIPRPEFIPANCGSDAWVLIVQFVVRTLIFRISILLYSRSLQSVIFLDNLLPVDTLVQP
jgi:hypothetical protein